MDSKQCVTCHVGKPLTEFNRRASSNDGRQPRCRDCCRAWYVTNKEAHKQRVAERNERTLRTYQQRLAEYLQEHPCVDCGEDDMRVLEFDHREGVHKVAEVSWLVNSLASWPRVLAEIEKCDVRCANCHRRVTAERGGFWRHLFMLTAGPQRRAEERCQALDRLALVFRHAAGGEQPQHP